MNEPIIHPESAKESGQNSENSTQANFKDRATTHATAFEKWLLPLFEKLPHIPEHGRKTIADIIPYVAIVFGALSLLSLFGLGVFSENFSPMFMVADGGGLFWLFRLIGGFGVAILMILAFKPLKAMQKKGWDYLFYGEIISLFVAVASIFSYAHMVSGNILGILIGTYLLFEIRGHYKA